MPEPLEELTYDLDKYQEIYICLHCRTRLTGPRCSTCGEVATTLVDAFFQLLTELNGDA